MTITRNRYKLLIEQTGQAWRLVERQCTHEGFKPGMADLLEVNPNYKPIRDRFDREMASRKPQPKELKL